MKLRMLQAGLMILAMGAGIARPQEAARLKLAAAAWHTIAKRNHGFESL
jgi:alpha-D-ribose 1-methylphosphonate 5-triphosphate synthase subunit PhnH